MNTVFENSFKVMPHHCNYMFPMIFGGAMFSKMDLCAASCVSRLLHDSECDSAVTYDFKGRYFAPTYMGDIIFMRAEVVELRHKSVRMIVTAHREKPAKAGRDKVGEIEFVFVTKKGDEFHPHGLKL